MEYPAFCCPLPQRMVGFHSLRNQGEDAQTPLKADHQGQTGGPEPDMPAGLQALRKEKSRNAARSRRGKENFEFYELAKMLPLPGAITSQLDKASIVRLTISYLKMRDFANHGDPPWSLRAENSASASALKAMGSQARNLAAALSTELFEQNLGGHILQSLDGFVFTVNQEGKFLYISETVSIYLGLSQVELTGSSVFDYIHPGDHIEVAEQLGLKSPDRSPSSLSINQKPLSNVSSSSSSSSSSSLVEGSDTDPLSPLAIESDTLERSFFVRMKSTLTKRGLHVKTSGYKVIHVTGCLRTRLPSFCHSHSIPGRVMGLVALAHTLPPSTLSEVRIDCHMFVFRVNMDLQIVYCESRITDYMDLSASDLVGKNCYQFVHAADVEGIRQSHRDLLIKGQVVTKYYRWLQKSGGFIWIQSCATISVNMKNPSERNMIWVNYILSKPECKDTPLDVSQLPAVPLRLADTGGVSDLETDFKENNLSPESRKGTAYPTKDTAEHCQNYSRSKLEQATGSSQDENGSDLTEANDRSEDNAEGEDDSDSEVSSGVPTRKRIKLEFQPEGHLDRRQGMALASSPSTDESDSGSEDEVDRVSPKRRKMERKLNGHQRSQTATRASTSEFTSVIQTQKNCPSKVSSALHIKTEQSLVRQYEKATMWGYSPSREGSEENSFTVNKELHADKSSLRNPTSNLYVSIPDSVLTPPEMDSSGSVQKVPFSSSPRVHMGASSSETLSPPLSGSPCEDRSTSTPFTPLLYPGEMEVFHRLHASNMVLPLVHQIGGSLSGHNTIASTSGSQGPYTTSTIRYAPADVTLSMPSNTLSSTHGISIRDLGNTDSKTPMELMYHHLQRLNMVAPFGNSSGASGLAQISGAMGGVFTAAESFFASQPFSMTTGNMHSSPTLERKEN
ncbi:neuronal PAS domain-containing protein 1 isoform X1 [Pleurodeles waltl]|uniref:neuronal PAS domain-containing protein 1 isoform X1 n=1 Tax=Pleurodeles waltl TaxID=8319 RepID=UPI0037096E48